MKVLHLLTDKFTSNSVVMFDCFFEVNPIIVGTANHRGNRTESQPNSRHIEAEDNDRGGSCDIACKILFSIICFTFLVAYFFLIFPEKVSLN